MSDAHLPLEDTFGDILRKAMRGNGIDTTHLAAVTGIAEDEIARWLSDDGTADDAEARALAIVLRLDGGKLADSAAQRWYPPPLERSDVRRHPQEPQPSNGYIFFLETGSRAALVDPAGEFRKNFLRIVRDGDYHLQYILITHKHSDHCDATADVAKQFPDADIVMHPYDVHAIGALRKRSDPGARRRATSVRRGRSIRMLHTPGHTDGSSCYLFKSRSSRATHCSQEALAARTARTPTKISSKRASKLFKLPEETVVMPGHGPRARSGSRKNTTPSSSARDYSRWADGTFTEVPAPSVMVAPLIVGAALDSRISSNCSTALPRTKGAR